MSELIFGFVNLIVFVLLFVGFFFLFQSLALREALKENMDKIYTKLAQKNGDRLSEIEEERRKYGTISGKNASTMNKVLNKIDDLIIYSGWYLRYKWLNTSTYIALAIVVASVTLLAVYAISGNLVLAIFLAFITLILPIIRMASLADKAYRTVEEQMLSCVNYVANNAAGSNNIVAVLTDVAPYMVDPLRTVMYRAISSAALSGDNSDCVRQLCREIEYPAFTRYMRSLEIAAANNSDFRTVSRNFADQMEMALKNSKRQKAIFSNGRANILTLIAVSILMITVICGYNGGNVFGTIAAMSGSLLGSFILLFASIVYIAAFLYMFLGMRR